MKSFWESIDLADIKGVVFDLDNTLCNTEDYYPYALTKCYQQFKKDFGGITQEEFEARYREAQNILKQNTKGQASSHSRFLYFQILFENYLGKTNLHLPFKYEELYYQAVFAKAKVYPGVKDFLKKLKKEKIKVLCLTDQTATLQFDKLKKFGLDKYVDFLVTSEEAGVEKLQTRGLKIILAKAQLKPTEVLMIGDSQRDEGVAKGVRLKGFYKFSH